MCGIVELASAAISTGFAVQQANERDADARDDAAYERDAARQQARNIALARQKRVSAARAATAASGTALDQFAEINTSDIERAGALDEQMVLLSGERRAQRMLRGQGDGAKAAVIDGFGQLLSTGYQSGWKGKRGGR